MSEIPPPYAGEDPDIELSMLESGAGLETKLQDRGYHFDSQRLHRPNEQDPLVEAKSFFMLAHAKFYALKEADKHGDADDRFRTTAFQSIYAFLRQAYVVAQELGDHQDVSLHDIEKFYVDVKTYQLNGCQMDDDKRQDYLQNISMISEGHKHQQHQAIQVMYDSVMSSRIATEGFDMKMFEYTLFEYLKRSLPHMTGLRIVHDFGSYHLQIDSAKPISKSETQIIFSLQDDVNVIAKIGEIHNKKFEEEREYLTPEEKAELLKVVTQLAKNLHATHPPTIAHNERLQKFWTRFVKDPILAYAPLLHDIGKVGVNLDTVEKPSGFSHPEREEIETHTAGTAHFICNMLGVKDFPELAVLAPSHHMNYAFRTASYPCYLPGNKISDCPEAVSAMLQYRSVEEAQHFIDFEIDDDMQVLIRLFATLDVVEAMTSEHREYRSPEEKDSAIRFIRSKAGLFFEPNVAAWLIEQIKNGKFDDELIISPEDESDTIKNPVFYSGGDVLTFLVSHQANIEEKHSIDLSGDISRLEESMNFDDMQLSSHLVEANIYNLFKQRDGVAGKLSPESEAEVKEIFADFADWMEKNDRAPRRARPITVEDAIASVNEQAAEAIAS